MRVKADTNDKCGRFINSKFQFLIGRIFLFVLLLANGHNVRAQLLNFTNYSLEQGLPSTGVFDFTMGPDGRLWMATDGGGVATFNGESFRIFNPEDGLNASIVRAICTDSLNRVWATSSENELYVFEGKWRVAFTADIFQGAEVRILKPGEGDEIFVGTSSGVAVVQGDSITWPSWNNQLPHRDIRDLLFQRDTLWIATDMGLYWVHEELLHAISIE